MKRIFYGKAEKGKLILADQQGFNLQICLLEGKEVVVTIAKKTKQRSLNQNRYYFGIVIKLISEVTGYTVDEAHDAMRFKFLRVVNDRGLETARSTTDLNTAEMELYLSQIRIFASTDLGCFIPDPNQMEESYGY